MKRMLAFTAFMITIFAASAFPATQSDKDKDDASINFINSNQPTTASTVEVDKNKNTVQPQVSVSVGGTIGVSVPGDDFKPTGPPHLPLPPPPKNPNVFSRFIDDIFQIPITVLQSVSKLLTNPFAQHNKDQEDTKS